MKLTGFRDIRWSFTVPKTCAIFIIALIHAKLSSSTVDESKKALNLNPIYTGEGSWPKDATFEPRVLVDVLGEIKGRPMTTFEGNVVSAFHSIPYAYKPTRFQVTKLMQRQIICSQTRQTPGN